jgi:tetratricopeptide (TPR) repeat protein
MRRAVVLWFFAALAWGQPYDRSPGFPAYQKANDLFVSKKLPEALSALEQSLKLDEKLVPALTLYAKIAMTMNRFELARDSLERALAVDPKAVYARFLYGLNFYLTNDLQHALPEFEKARQANPKDARAALYLGLTYESLGRTGEAMERYEEAASLEPAADTYLIGARLLQLLGRLDEGSRWIQRALRMEPNSRDAHFEFARLLLRKADPLRAAREGERALALTPGSVTDAQIHFLLVRAYRENDPARSAQHADALRASENR